MYNTYNRRRRRRSEVDFLQDFSAGLEARELAFPETDSKNKQRFHSAEESDTRQKEVYQLVYGKNWVAIASYVENRTNRQCLARAKTLKL